jgi:hypothetical protein
MRLKSSKLANFESFDDLTVFFRVLSCFNKGTKAGL